MSDYKVERYEAEAYGDYQLGHAFLSAKGKVDQIVKVCKDRNGNFYCTFIAVKVCGKWVPSFSFINKEYEKKLLKELMEKITPFMTRGLKDAEVPYEGDDEDLPF